MKYVMRLCAFFIALMLSFNGLSATYYVKNGGNNAAAGTSDGTAWSDVTQSVAKLAAGDTLLLKRGSTFNETNTVTVEDINVTIDAYDSGALPIISGQSWTEPGSMYTPQLQFGSTTNDATANGGTIRNISLLRSAGFALNIYSDNVTIDGVTVTESLLSGITVFNGSSGTTISNVTVTGDNYGYANQDSFPDLNIITWGAGIANKGSGTIIQNSFVTAGNGEAINNNCGAFDFIVRGNRVEGGKVGIYADVVQDGLIERNIVVRLDGHGSYATAIGLNNEPNCYNKAVAAGLSGITQNIVIRNNLVAGFKNGLWLADEIGMNNSNYPAYTNSAMSGIYIYGNTLVDNEKQINLYGGAWNQSWIKNNVFHTFTSPTSVGMINGISTAVSMPVISYNYFTTAPPSSHTNSVTSGIDLVKETGWRTAATGVIVANSFEAEGASTTYSAGTATLGNSQIYNSDYYQNIVSGTPNIGAFDSTDGGGGTVIKRIKFLSNTARLRTITGAEYTGPLDFFLLTNSDPRLPGTKNDLVYIDNPSISNGVINFTETNVQCATCTGSINALNPGQYWYSTRSEDGSVKSVYTINVVAE